MRWERLFDELEGHAEHEHLQERESLIAELRDGEWADRTWIDGLSDEAVDVEVSVQDIGVLSGRVRWATSSVFRLETASVNYVISSSAVQWVRGTDQSPGLRRGSVRSRLGWGPVLREARDDGESLVAILIGGLTCEGTVTAVGSDFVRLLSASGERDLPTAALRAVRFSG